MSPAETAGNVWLDVLDNWGAIYADFARFYPHRDLAAMGSSEFWTLLLGLPKESNWHLLVVAQKYTPAASIEEAAPEVIEDPEEGEAAIWSAFQSF